MYTYHGSRRRITLALAGLACAAAGISATPATKAKHYGWQGNRASPGDWISCSDKNHPSAKSAVITLDADVGNGTGAPILSSSDAQVRAVYSAAFSTCFLSDADDDSVGVNGPNQYEDGATGGAIVRVRPASYVNSLKAADLTPNTGLFVADYYVRLGTYARPAAGGGPSTFSLPEDRSTLLWVGMDKNSKLYAVEFDLQQFPSVSSPPSGTTLRIVSYGNWTFNPRVKHSRAAPFARFSDPTHDGVHAKARRHKARHRRFMYPDGTWVGCDPGCCTANGMLMM